MIFTPAWWNGIHIGLKIRRRKTYGFKSRRRHQQKPVWCNGSTRDFDSRRVGSNPATGAN